MGSNFFDTDLMDYILWDIGLDSFVLRETEMEVHSFFHKVDNFIFGIADVFDDNDLSFLSEVSFFANIIVDIFPD